MAHRSGRRPSSRRRIGCHRHQPAAFTTPSLIPLLDLYAYPAVSARELHRFLKLSATNYSKWMKKNIVENPYASSGEDGVILPAARTEEDCSFVGTYNYVQDYDLTLNLAKRLAMMTRSERGEQAQTYFLNCERIALEAYGDRRSGASPDVLEALRSLATTIEEKEQLEQENKAAQNRLDAIHLKATVS